MATKELVLVCGTKTLVDDDIYKLVRNRKWRLNMNGYAVWTSSKNGKNIHVYLHRLANNTLPSFDTDHKNRNKLDNRRCNLRSVTHSQNCMNSRVRSDGVSKYKGVYWKKETSKWGAKINLNYKQIHLGYFKCEDDAAHAYNQGAKKYHCKFANLNKIGGTND